MRILHIISKSDLGGAQTWVNEQVKIFSQDAEFYLVTNKPGCFHEGDFSSTFYIESLDSYKCVFSIFKVAKFIRDNKIDLVVASSANAGLVARLTKLLSSVKVVYVSHGWSCVYNGGRLKWMFVLIEWLLAFITDRVICVSNQDFIIAKETIRISESKLSVIRNGIIPRQSKTLTSNSVGEKMKLLFVGRLCPPKRPDLLIESIYDMDDVILDIVGDGPMKKTLRFSENVNLLGNISSFDDFKSYDLFCLISDSEGLPMSALEAASSGIPLLLSNVGGCAELINDNGILVNNDRDSIRNAILKIKSNYNFYCELANSVKGDFNVINSKHLYEAVYWKDVFK